MLSLSSRGNPVVCYNPGRRAVVPARIGGTPSLDLFLARSVPFMARRNYLIELKHLLLWGIFIGMFEGAGSSIIVAKTFHGSDWLITVVMAIPTVANLAGIFWGSYAASRPKLPLFFMFGLGTVALIGSVGLTPHSELGGWIFAAQVGLARTLLSGCVTVRSGFWKHNYPVEMRGRIAARLQIVRYSLGIVVVTLVSLLFDYNPTFYHFVYPAVALVGLLGIWRLRPLHVRGERAEFARRARQNSNEVSPEWNLLLPIRQAAAVLRDDAAFRRYCSGMMLLGMGNIMIFPVMAIIITKELPLNYNHSSILMETLPQFMMMVSLMSWAGLFDRRGVVRFRVLNAFTWAMASVFGGLAAIVLLYPGALDSLTLFVVAISMVAMSRFFEGLGRGGGAIGWNLGHLHFAEPAKAEIYMGAHVFLTGIRGLTAPFIGTWLYSNFGPAVFLVSAALGFSGMLTFRSLVGREVSKAVSDELSDSELAAEAAAAPVAAGLATSDAAKAASTASRELASSNR